jgi:putative acyl-CoA dehydrogenase
MTLQASLLVRHAPDFVSDAFIASRLQGDWGSAFGTLGRSTAFTDIIARAAQA